MIRNRIFALCYYDNLGEGERTQACLAQTRRAIGEKFVKQQLRSMPEQTNNPLHGITLEQIVKGLVEYYGWEDLGLRIDIRCFNSDPSVKSSLKFLRKTPWARKKVEALYLHVQEIEKSSGN